MVIITSLRVFCCFLLPVLEEFGTTCFKQVCRCVYTYIFFSSFNITPSPNTKTREAEMTSRHDSSHFFNWSVCLFFSFQRLL